MLLLLLLLVVMVVVLILGRLCGIGRVCWGHHDQLVRDLLGWRGKREGAIVSEEGRRGEVGLVLGVQVPLKVLKGNRGFTNTERVLEV